MEDFFYAGGLPAVMKEILASAAPGLHHGDGQDAWARTSSSAECCRREVIRTAADPLHPEGGTAVLHGNLAPDGAVIQADRGVAAAYCSIAARLTFSKISTRCARRSIATICRWTQRHGAGDEELRTERRAGISRMGTHPDATRAAESGHRRHGADQRRAYERHQLWHSGVACGARIRDRRAAGGSAHRRRNFARCRRPAASNSVSATEDCRRGWRISNPPPPHYDRGYGRMFLEHVTQANEGCDFDFLRPV